MHYVLMSLSMKMTLNDSLYVINSQEPTIRSNLTIPDNTSHTKSTSIQSLTGPSKSLNADVFNIESGELIRRYYLSRVLHCTSLVATESYF